MAIAWIAIVLALIAIDLFAPQRSGTFALIAILEPFLALSAIVAVPLALFGRGRLGISAVVVLALVLVARYLPGLTTGPMGAESVLTVTTWNVEAGDNAGERVVDGLRDVTSDLVALEELQPEMADAVTGDHDLADRYPYASLHPDRSVLGVGLLSRFPILESSANQLNCPAARSSCTSPPMLRAVVQPPDGRPVVVFVVHPLPGHIQTLLHVPIGIDTQERDADIAFIRAAVDADLSAGRTVILMGDFNTTEREPAYKEFSAGLNDARFAGTWPGLTWRPDVLNGLPFGLLRIDYVLSSLAPTAYSVRCTTLSDHCIVSASLHAS